MRIETHAREITTAAEMRAGYQAAHARLWGAVPVQPKPEPMPMPPVEIEEASTAVEEITHPLPNLPPRPDPFAGLNLAARTVHRIVAAHYGITLGEIRGPSRLAQYVTPRQIAMFICARHFGMSSCVAARFTHRDHSTAFHAVRQIDLRMARDAVFAAEVAALVVLCRAQTGARGA